MSAKLQETGSSKTTKVVLGLVALGLGLGWAGWEIYSKFSARPPTPVQMRPSIWSFLREQTKGKSFQTTLDLSTASWAGRAVVGMVTNKTGQTTRGGAANKTGNPSLPETTLSAYFRTNQAQAASYPEMFQLVGEQLTVTEQLLAQTEEPPRLLGLVMAGEASTYARTNALNPWLGARICEVYLWPNLTLVETTNLTPLTLDAVLNVCELAFREAGETNHMVRNYEMLIAKSSNPTRADAARFRLSIICEERGDEAQALKLLKEIKNIKTAHIARKIAALEAKAPPAQP